MKTYFISIVDYIMSIMSMSKNNKDKFGKATKKILKAANKGGGFSPIFTDEGIIVRGHTIHNQRHIESLKANEQPIIFERCQLKDVNITGLPAGTSFLGCNITESTIIAEQVEFETTNFGEGVVFAGKECLLDGCTFEKGASYDAANSTDNVHRGTTFVELTM
jgi:hypothetical protein